MNNFSFLVYRQEKIDVSVAVVVKVKTTLNSAAEIVEAINKGVAKWAAESFEGHIAHNDVMGDMNIGDLGNYDIDFIIGYCPEIKSLKIEGLDIDRAWTYDTILCPLLEEEN